MLVGLNYLQIKNPKKPPPKKKTIKPNKTHSAGFLFRLKKSGLIPTLILPEEQDQLSLLHEQED